MRIKAFKLWSREERSLSNWAWKTFKLTLGTFKLSLETFKLTLEFGIFYHSLKFISDCLNLLFTFLGNFHTSWKNFHIPWKFISDLLKIFHPKNSFLKLLSSHSLFLFILSQFFFHFYLPQRNLSNLSCAWGFNSNK